MATNPNDPAMPFQEMPGGFVQPAYGLTKREEFAKAALQGLLARPRVSETTAPQKSFQELAVRYADLLIKALNESEAA